MKKQLVIGLVLLTATFAAAATFRLYEKTAKTALVGADILGIEDSENSWNVKKASLDTVKTFVLDDQPYIDWDLNTLQKTGTGTVIDPEVIGVKPNTFATKKADTNTLQFSFNSTELGVAETAPAGHMIFEVPVTTTWTTGELVCDGTTTTGLQITVASSPAADGTLTPYSETIGTEGAIDVSLWADPSAGTNISAWVNTASTGDATWCRLIFTLSN